MDWKKVAMEDLRKYSAQRASLDNIREKIAVLQGRFTDLKGSTITSTPIQGGGNHMEDSVLNNIVERGKLKNTYKATKALVELTEKGLNGLDKYERRTLELFYIRPHRRCVETLKAELGYEQRQIYRIKDNALYKFTITMYGLIDY